MKKNNLSSEDWIRICECIKRCIAEKTKIISQKMDSYSCQYLWDLATDVDDDFKLLSKVEELCGEEE